MFLISECKVDPNQGSPLYIAASRSEFEICCKLVTYGAGVCAENKRDGSQPIDAVLMGTGYKGGLSVLCFLIENGADVMRVKSGLTPLIYAVKSGKIEYVKRIVELGADVMQSCGNGLVKLTAIHFSKDAAITEYLRKIEGKRGKVVVSGVASVGSSSESPPAYTPPVASVGIGKCCVETESRVRAECADALSRLREEHEREVARLREEHDREKRKE
jgi:hypothetical protein